MKTSSETLSTARQLVAAGRLAEAEAACRKCCQRQASDTDAFNLLGQILCQQGKFAEAVDSIEQAISLRPEDAVLHQNLGEVHRLTGSLDLAEDHYRRATGLAEGDAAPRFGLARVLTMRRKYDEAIAQFREVLKQHPQNAQAENGLGSVYRLTGQLDQAVQRHRAALQLQPDLADTHVSLALALKDQGDVEQAVEHNEEALRLEPNHAIAHNNLGFALIQLGKFDTAVVHLEEALRLNPNNARAYHNLGLLVLQEKYRFSSEQLDRIRKLLANNRVSPDSASVLHFTIGATLDQQGQYDEAFHAYQQGNAIRHQLLVSTGASFDLQRHIRLIDATVHVFNTAFFEKTRQWGLRTELPIFVVGMPRSGTSLVHEIIASHPGAAGAGELRDIKSLADDLPALLGGTKAYPDCLDDADRDTICTLAQRYLDRIGELANGSQRVVDKMWHNFVHLGFIATMFPEARVVHCVRDPMDIGLSCFVSNFNYINWTCRLEDIADYYRQYERLIRHWQKVLPLRIHEVSYQRLVGEPEKQCRELVEYCGLEWDEKCLDFYESRRAVKTASSVQVRRPIYSTSVDRWKKYQKHLLPLERALAGNRQPVREKPQSISTDQTGNVPAVVAPLYQRGVEYYQSGRFREAIGHYEKAIEIQPEFAEAHDRLATALWSTGNVDRAIEHYLKAIDIKPEYESPYYNLAYLYESLHQLEEATRYVHQALELRADNAEALRLASTILRRQGKYQEALGKLASIPIDKVDDRVAIHVHFDMGKLYDHLDDTEKAMHHLTKGNDLQARLSAAIGIDKTKYLDHIKGIRRGFTKSFVESWSVVSSDNVPSAPVFLVGFPRSGTTLLDQILDSHPQIHVMEEKPMLDNLVTAILNLPGSYPLALASLDEDKIARLRENYFREANEFLDPPSKGVVVDKCPLHIADVGLIHRVFPDAKIITAIRHPHDVCLSCFMQYFKSTHAMASFFAIEDAAELYDCVMGLWQSYVQLLPLKYHSVKYESVVDNFEPEVGRLLQFLGVAWDSAVLEYVTHARNRGLIGTPSYSQVTEPIYKTAKYRWHRYKQFLEPVLEKLKPHVAYFDY